MTGDTVRCDVLIAGGGPTGLTLGIQLARCGLSFRIVDAAPGPATTSRAIAIQPRTLELFDEMGVVDAIEARGVRFGSADIYVDKRRVGGLNLAAATDTRHPSVIALSQDETEGVLRDRLHALGGDVEWGVALASFAQDADGVTATLRRADGAEETARARWLVGCDGAHSAVRHGLKMPFTGGAYVGTYWLADVHLRGDLAHPKAHIFLGDEGAALAFPLAGAARFRLFIIWREGLTPPEGALDLPRMQAALAAFAPPGVAIADAAWFSVFRLSHRKVARYREGRVFLVGDAAHIHSPAGGRGMNTGIQDACNLAWKLVLAESGRAQPAVLASYDAERGQVAEAVIRQTDRPFRLITTGIPALRWVRDHLVPPLVSRSDTFMHSFTGAVEFSIRYRRSPIVARDPGGAGIPAGMRAPDADLRRLPDSAETRLATLRAADATRHTLVLLCGAQPDRAGALAEIGAMVRARYAAEIAVIPVVIGEAPPCSGGEPWYTDPDGAMHRTYGTTTPLAYLIRPDGHVGWRGTAATALWAHLATVFV